jgi:hypothetical protein
MEKIIGCFKRLLSLKKKKTSEQTSSEDVQVVYDEATKW